MNSINHLMVAIDYTSISDRALEWATELAKTLKSKITILHIYPFPGHNSPKGNFLTADEVSIHIPDVVNQELQKRFEQYRDSGVEIHTVLKFGIPEEEICNAAEELNADWIIMGTHGRGTVESALLGSVANYVIRHSEKPVTTICGKE